VQLPTVRAEPLEHVLEVAVRRDADLVDLAAARPGLVEQRLDLLLLLVGQLLAVAVEELDAVVLGGLWDAVITQPRSSVSSATAGVGSTPATTALPPADAIPLASALSSSIPDARVSRPTKMRPRPDQSVAARPRRSTRSAVRSSPTTPRTPSVPKYWRPRSYRLLNCGALRALCRPAFLRSTIRRRASGSPAA
jgi:hypothetical protein